MRSSILAAVLFVAIAFSASPAKAQVYVGTTGPLYSNGGPSYGTWYVTPNWGASPVYHGGTYFPPYDYYAAYPMPSRIYSSGFSNDFPYYGKPYGHPSTPWSWATLSTYPTSGGPMNNGSLPAAGFGSTNTVVYGYVLGY